MSSYRGRVKAAPSIEVPRLGQFPHVTLPGGWKWEIRDGAAFVSGGVCGTQPEAMDICHRELARFGNQDPHCPHYPRCGCVSPADTPSGCSLADSEPVTFTREDLTRGVE